MSPVMTVAEAAAFLKVSDDVLYPMLARGEIPAGKVKGQWRLIEDDLLNWLRSQYSVKARAPSDVEVLCHTGCSKEWGSRSHEAGRKQS